MNQLEMYTQLFTIKMNLEQIDSPLTKQEFNSIISKAHERISRLAPLDDDDMERLFHKDLAPQMNQLIPELIKHGFAPNYLAEYFKVTPAAISYNRSHTSKKEYVNIVLQNVLRHYEPVYKEYIEEHTGNRITPRFSKYVYKR